MCRLLSPILFLLAGLPALQAQFSTLADTITVQSARVPARIGETGRNISLLDPADLQQAPYTSLDELLQYVPGVEVQSRNAFGVQGDISLRGATFTQVLVLIDGMKLNDPLTGHFNHAIPVTPAEIARIEVLRGAASAIYGADAVGGVINIVTKTHDPQQDDATQLEGQLHYGEHSLLMARQGFALQRGKLFLSGGFRMNQSAGEPIAERPLGNITLEAYRNFFDIKTAGLNLGYRLGKGWLLRARTAYDQRDFSARFFYTASPLDQSEETTTTWWNQLRATRTGQRSRTDIHLAYKRNTDRFVFNPDFPSTNEHLSQFYNLNANHSLELSPRWSVNLGTQFTYRTIESNDRGNHDDTHAGLYGMAVWRPLRTLTLTGSLRYDYDENYGSELTPQLNIAYQVLPRLRLRASAGRSIRAADYTERYVSFNLADLSPGRNLGNPDLLAERSWSQELGLDADLGEHLQLKATGFLRQGRNLIDYVETNAADIPNNDRLQEGADYFFAQNIADVRTQGVEAELWYRRALGRRGHLQASLGYIYLNTGNPGGLVSVYISSHARHLLTANLRLRAGAFELGVNGLYKQRNDRFAESIDSTLEPAYTLWNARAGYRILPELGLSLQVHNLFDADYQDILGAPMPGRWVMGGLFFNLPAS